MPENEVDLLEAAAREAGAIARRYVTGANKSWQKGNGSPVSEADLAVDAFLKERLRSARPDYGWLSEESEDDPARHAARRVFVVDPIDGTTAILRHEPQFTVCAAVVCDHVPVAAAVYNPLTDEMFVADAGQGAFLNRKPIHVGDRGDLTGGRILVRHGLTARDIWHDDPWPAMHEEDRRSAAYRIALVAAGRFDASVSLTSKCDWDLAAADLIVREAGGRLTDYAGEGFRYNLAGVIHSSAIAANPTLLARIVSRTARIAPLPRTEAEP